MKNLMSKIAIVISLILTTGGLSASGNPEVYLPPKLVILIALDQGRYDYPWPRDNSNKKNNAAYDDGYGPTNYNYQDPSTYVSTIPGTSTKRDSAYQTFFQEGTIYADTAYYNTCTFTDQGHSSMVVGGYPRYSGIPTHQWMDYGEGKFVYSDQPIPGEDVKIIYDTRFPAPESYPNSSSRLLEVTDTIGDKLIEKSPNSKVISVGPFNWPYSIMAGEKGTPFWWDLGSGDGNGTFITSSYYCHEGNPVCNGDLPDWVKAFNGSPDDFKTNPAYNTLKKYGAIDTSGNAIWQPKFDKTKYLNSKSNVINRKHVAPPCYPTQPAIGKECAGVSLGIDFTHTILPANPAEEQQKAFNLLFSFTPYLDKMIADFAIEAIKNEKLGQDDDTDFLMIGLPATDQIGHNYGINSLEHEDNFYRLDQTLSNLFQQLPSILGSDWQKDVLIVLAGDHGMDSIPAYLREARGINAGRLFTESVINGVELFLKERSYAPIVPEKPVIGIRAPHLYLYRGQWREDLTTPIELSFVQDQVAIYLENQFDGIDKAYGAISLRADRTKSPTSSGCLVNAEAPLDRSGDVIIEVIDHTYFYEVENDAAMHGTKYGHDQRAQFFFWGGGALNNGVVVWSDDPNPSSDYAAGRLVPTLAKILGLDTPKGLDPNNKELEEIVSNY